MNTPNSAETVSFVERMQKVFADEGKVRKMEIHLLVAIVASYAALALILDMTYLDWSDMTMLMIIIYPIGILAFKFMYQGLLYDMTGNDTGLVLPICMSGFIASALWLMLLFAAGGFETEWLSQVTFIASPASMAGYILAMMVYVPDQREYQRERKACSQNLMR